MLVTSALAPTTRSAALQALPSQLPASRSARAAMQEHISLRKKQLRVFLAQRVTSAPLPRLMQHHVAVRLSSVLVVRPLSHLLQRGTTHCRQLRSEKRLELPRRYAKSATLVLEA